ncbi:MAG: hypothetical protein ACUZ77_10685 [Candidatus Brocadiales bacterium]
MATFVNKKKLVSICPVKMSKSVCPSIRKTRQIRRELLTESKAVAVNEKRLESLRKRLRDRRVKGISVDCEACVYNQTKQAV